MAIGTPSPVGAYIQPVGGSAIGASLVAPSVAFQGSVQGIVQGSIPWQGRPQRDADEAVRAGEVRAVYWEAIHAERTISYTEPIVSSPSIPVVLVRFVAAVLPGAPLAPPLLAPPPVTDSSPGSLPHLPRWQPHPAQTLTDTQLFAQALDDKITVALTTPQRRARSSMRTVGTVGPGERGGSSVAAADGCDVAWGEAGQSALTYDQDDQRGANRAPPIVLLLDVAGLTLRVDAPEDWADPLLDVLCRWCPALPMAASAAPVGAGAYSGVEAGPARIAGGVDHTWAFFDSSGMATLSLPHLGLTLAAPISATLAMYGASPNPQVVVSDFLAQARQLLIHAACQRHGVQTHWASTRVEAEALLAPWWPLV